MAWREKVLSDLALAAGTEPLVQYPLYKQHATVVTLLVLHGTAKHSTACVWFERPSALAGEPFRWVARVTLVQHALHKQCTAVVTLLVLHSTAHPAKFTCGATVLLNAKRFEQSSSLKASPYARHFHPRAAPLPRIHNLLLHHSPLSCTPTETHQYACAVCSAEVTLNHAV